MIFKLDTEFLLALTVLFVFLKLTNIIEWNWFWVLCPILLPIGILVFWLLFILFIWIHYTSNKK